MIFYAVCVLKYDSFEWQELRIKNYLQNVN